MVISRPQIAAALIGCVLIAAAVVRLPDRSEPYPEWLLYIGLIPQTHSNLQFERLADGSLRPIEIHRLRWAWQL